MLQDSRIYLRLIRNIDMYIFVDPVTAMAHIPQLWMMG
jgi:hypothetical protein